MGRRLDESYVAVQGRPGSGKTYSGSPHYLPLIKVGKRVGITAMSTPRSKSFDATYEVSLKTRWVYCELYVVARTQDGALEACATRLG